MGNQKDNTERTQRLSHFTIEQAPDAILWLELDNWKVVTKLLNKNNRIIDKVTHFERHKMRDEDKTKEQIIKELIELHQ